VLVSQGLTVRFPGTGRDAVAGVDLDVGDGEVVCVVGPSGSGKSTLLRAIAGLEPLTAGSVVRGGADLAGVPPHRRELGLMFQDHALFPHRDVLGNVAFGLRMQGSARADAEARARATLALVGLAGSEHRPVRELSGGEQQRVALARAIAPEPTLLMLDEPLGALDRRLREHLADELRELFDRLDLTVLLVTHDQDEAFALGDRVAVMHDGRIDQIGTPTDVWREPATEFVARFLGWNVTDALSVNDAAIGEPGVDGIAAVRPDMLHIESHGRLAGTVVARSFRRDHFLVRVALDPSRDEIDVIVPGDAPPPVGTALRLAVTPGALRRL
jgi:thiamine transport system ATP-binding protein